MWYCERTPLRKIGKKGREWVTARKKIIEKAVRVGKLDSDGYGVCESCKQFRRLTLDHIEKRSAGGKHNWENIAFLCWPCHDKKDNQ